MPLKKLIRLLRSNVKPYVLPSFRVLDGLMKEKYQTKNLVGVTPAEFRSKLDIFMGLRDAEMEGFADASKQRDLSIQFHWGHDHDFGEFKLGGRMTDRHIHLVSVFIDRFKAIPISLQGLRVLDIGCWTGGTSLLLCAMGAEVVAIEEVKKYVDCVNYLKSAFNIKKLTVLNRSLYECTNAEFQDSFDVILFAGVLYHISDPVIALRILFNALKDGGVCLAETMSIESSRNLLEYWGPNVFLTGSKDDLSRGGWNWYVPSPGAFSQMLTDVGFENVVEQHRGGRAFAAGRRTRHVDMMRSGLSVRNIR